MKSLFFSTTFKILSFSIVFAFPLLMSFSPVRVPESRPIDLPEIEMRKLVDNALKDSLFALVTEADIKRLLGKINSNRSISKQKWDELAKKKNFSAQETEYIFSHFGFMSVADFTSYANLLASLGKKYGIDKLNENDQKRFFDALRKEQVDYIANNNLLEETFKKYAYSGGMPSECWKCVYDYKACLNGGASWVISYTPVSSTTTTYDMSNGGISITRITYTTPSNPQITYVNPQYSTASCEGIYRNCMGSCATP